MSWIIIARHCDIYCYKYALLPSMSSISIALQRTMKILSSPMERDLWIMEQIYKMVDLASFFRIDFLLVSEQ